MTKSRAQLQEDKAHEIIAALDGFTFTEQMSALIGVMLSYVIANLSGDAAEQVVSNIAAMLPRQYIEARTMMQAQDELNRKINGV